MGAPVKRIDFAAWVSLRFPQSTIEGIETESNGPVVVIVPWSYRPDEVESFEEQFDKAQAQVLTQCGENLIGRWSEELNGFVIQWKKRFR